MSVYVGGKGEGGRRWGWGDWLAEGVRMGDMGWVEGRGVGKKEGDGGGKDGGWGMCAVWVVMQSANNVLAAFS